MPRGLGGGPHGRGGGAWGPGPVARDPVPQILSTFFDFILIHITVRKVAIALFVACMHLLRKLIESVRIVQNHPDDARVSRTQMLEISTPSVATVSRV